MREEHYKSKLSAFIDRELSASDQQSIAEHLMQCGDCRAEHDRLKLGSALAQSLTRHDAPAGLWNSIESSIEDRTASSLGLIPDIPFFGRRGIAGFAAAAVVVAIFVSGVYLTLFRAEQTETVRVEPTEQNGLDPFASPAIVSMPTGTEPPPQISNANIPGPHAGDAVPAGTSPAPMIASVESFRVETLAGTPRVGTASTAGSLAEGDFLETDAASKARIRVADIGNVEIEPNSRVKLVGTDPKQHRLSLERGALEAKIYAPPRLFIVDTPSAVAVDLGCAYRLEVDKDGNSFLHVTSGFVALERDGRESIVPAGAMCATRRGKGLGTPYSADANENFKAALARFDFSGGGTAAVAEMLEHRSRYDVITLWHLLSRVGKADRKKVFEALVGYVAVPDGVTREGVLSLNKKMLESWRQEVENVWFE